MDNSFFDGLFHKQENGAIINVDCFSTVNVSKIMSMLKGNLIYDNPNAGGTSKISEAISYEIMRNIFNFKLDHLETEISYESVCKNGLVCVDYSGTVPVKPPGSHHEERRCFVSVTRLTEFLQTINNSDNRTTYTDVVNKILHKFIGFTNVVDEKSKYIHEYVTNTDIGVITVETVVHDYLGCLNVLFIWVENKLVQMVRDALENELVVEKIKEYNVTIIIAPTNSSLIMYEDTNTTTTDEYYKSKYLNAQLHKQDIMLSRIEKSRQRQYRVLHDILRAVRNASRRIVSLCPRKKVMKEIANNGYCILYKWVFTSSDNDNYGLFRSYYISNLIHIMKYTQEMKLVDQEKKRSLVEMLLDYYNKKGDFFTIKYLKGKEKNKDTGMLDLVGGIIITPRDTNIEAHDVFDF